MEGAFHVKPQLMTEYYETQTSLLRLDRRIEEVSKAVRQAKYDLRTAEETLLNYQASVKSFLDRFSGKRVEKEETLRRRIREAEAKLKILLREKETLDQRQTEWKGRLKEFPSGDQLRQSADVKQWAALEAKYCAEALDPLLVENHKALLEYRSLLRGEYPILTYQRQQEICAEPNVWAEQCVPYLHRLKEALDILEVSFSLGSYYKSPVAYLVNVAADHNRRDRVNQALDQVEEIQRIVKDRILY